MNAETRLSILFADISQSTHLYETFGDREARALVSACLSRLSKAAGRRSGTVVKTIGDEVMCTFHSPQTAVEAARDMHKALDETLETRQGAPSRSLDVRIGIHAGRVIVEKDDIFGDAVNVAARLVELAKPRQILASTDVVEGLDPMNRTAARFLGRIHIRGKEREFAVYEVVWEEYDMTIITDQALTSGAISTSMELEFGGARIRVGPSRPLVTLGREETNDLVLPGSHVSRHHALVQYQGGKFFLSDQSSNGTYVCFQGGETVHLRRDRAILHGTGSISPGARPTPDTLAPISFLERQGQ